MNYIIGKNIKDFSFVTNAIMPEKMILQIIIAHKIDNLKGEQLMNLYFYIFDESTASIKTTAVEVKETPKYYKPINGKFPYPYSTMVSKECENTIGCKGEDAVMYSTDPNGIEIFKNELIDIYKQKKENIITAANICDMIIDKIGKIKGAITNGQHTLS